MKSNTTKGLGTKPNAIGLENSASPWTAPLTADPPEDRALNAYARAWLADLPKAVQPVALAQAFPRICNRIGERWLHPDLMIPYFDALMMDDRRGRQGFPLAIVLEIANLKEYFLDALAKDKLDVADCYVNRP